MFNSTDEMEVILGVMSGEKLGNVIERQEKRGQNNFVRSQKLPCVYRGENYTDKLAQMGIKPLEDHNEQFVKGELFFAVELPEGWSVKPSDHSMWSYLKDDKDRERASIFYKAAFYDRDAFLNFNRRFSVSYKKSDYDELLFEQQPEYIKDGDKTVTVWVDDDGREVDYKSKSKQEVYFMIDGYIEKDGYSWSRGKTIRPLQKPKYKKNPDYVKLTGYEKYSQPFHYEVHDHDGTILFSSDVVKTDYEYSKDNHYEFFKHMEQVEKAASGQCHAWLEENYPDYQNVLAYWN